jgi:hypothetical protein
MLVDQEIKSSLGDDGVMRGDVVLGRVPLPTEEWLEADARLADSTSTAWDLRAHLSCPVPAC